ncbi:MAG: glycosyltransferase family 4 protein [Ignavibacteria bacterium]|nr:glycosyltransferase family 4 protein [Ignavibacteria bacterium]
MKRKVLVIAYYFPPMGFSGVQRTAKFVKYLVDFNWEPTVLTIKPKYYYAFDDVLLKEIEERGIRIIRTGSKDPTQKVFNQKKIKSDFLRKVLNRISQTFFLPDNKRSWTKPALKEARKLLSSESFDIIFATAPPYTDFLIGAKLKKEFNIPLILDYRDAWLDDGLSFYPTPVHRWIVKGMERKVLNLSDKIIAYTRQIKEHILKNYPFIKPDEISIIPHGYDEEDFDLNFVPSKSPNKMRITYSGAFYDERTPKFFLKAVEKLFVERPDLESQIEFYFVGNLPKKYYRKIQKSKYKSNFHFTGYVDHKTNIQYLLNSDVLWLMIRHSKNPHLYATSKLFEYIGTGKPILACVPRNGAAAMILKDYEASFIIEPDDVDGIKNYLIELFDLFKKNQLPVGDKKFIQQFERKKLTQELVKIFQFTMKDEA